MIACNWLKASNANLYNLENYSHEYNIRTKKQGGGVSLFIRNNLNYIIREDFKMSKQFNCIAIEILKESINHTKNLIVVVIYRPPNSSIKDFNIELERVLESIDNEQKVACVLGDFNIDTFKNINIKHGIHTNQFSNLFTLHGYMKMIHKPTRVQANREFRD